MPAQVIDGKTIAQETRKKIAEDVQHFFALYGRAPGLAVVLAGDDPASRVYVNNKIKACEETGIASNAYMLPAAVSQAELISLIKELNLNAAVDGILVQLPLPKGLCAETVLSHISPFKDVDGFTAVNAGRLMLGSPALTACTPSGCIELIKSAGVSIAGKHAVVVGRSNIVGKPAALLLLSHNATVTVCHSKTQNLAEITRQADILIAAVGIKHFITGDMIKDGAVVIDVGINRFEGKLYGDAEFDSCFKKASFITPVPGGVGPMTIAMLLRNTLSAAQALAKERLNYAF
ncbi:MAG: bifunctional methylenetetrahydrofolate dehydrogenase/methenyltetrahydrofolate cyclohydrolase FolD [Firmicutes bacterium]|nr:bifunctional methylenetetrahydrofolate dehydrogenase/methenyltetrahydrofolate cyclohydrolase FolD [Bacillota bacterium]